MSILDAFLCLVIAAKLHGTDARVKRVAKIVVKRLPIGERKSVKSIIRSKAPRAHVLRALDMYVEQ